VAAAPRYTHLAWAFAAVGVDGSLVPAAAGDPAAWRSFNAAVKAAAPGLHTSLAVGGWAFSSGATAGRWSAMVATPRTRAAFVTSAVQTLTAGGFDGLDIDWEFPGAPDRGGRPTDAAGLVALVTDLRAAFSTAGGRRLGLTVALPAGGPYARGFDVARLAPHVDWFHVMAYDLAGGGRVTGAHTGIAGVTAAVRLYRGAGVPPSRLVLGTAAYGRTWAVVDAAACAAGGGRACAASGVGRAGACSGEAGFLSNREIAAARARSPPVGGVLDGAAWALVDGDTYVSYDTAATLEVKRAYARAQGLRGWMVWSVDQVV